MSNAAHPTPLSAALDKVGGATQLASKLGVTPQAISQWRKVPASRVLAVEAHTGIRRELLRPDIYPTSEPRPSLAADLPGAANSSGAPASEGFSSGATS